MYYAAVSGRLNFLSAPPLTVGPAELDEMPERLLATFRDVAATLGG